MQSLMVRLLVAVLLLWCASSGFVVDALGLTQLGFKHKFSDEVVQGVRGRWSPPTKDTVDYHQFVLRHDLARHGRRLADVADRLYTFYDGNETFINTDGLQYSLVEVGTPSVEFFVALDTGSDLFWVPCECKSCATPDANSKIPYGIYTPGDSNTSKAISCGNSACADEYSNCTVSTGQCKYRVDYLISNTSTSGTIYEDVLALSTTVPPYPLTTTTVVLGCGQTQTGELLGNVSVVDGLIGLGRLSYTIPSLMASSGTTADSFSMCFDFDGSGRITFGDVGSPNIPMTPFTPGPATSETKYYIKVDSITIGKTRIPFGDDVLVDTGTTLTFLSTPVYNSFISTFAKLETVYNRTFALGDVFDLCYEETDLNPQAPLVKFNMAGGTSMQINGLLAFFFNTATQNLVGFCVAVLDGGPSFSILGANFLSGYNIVFNRGAGALGFENGTCYETVAVGTSGPEMSPSPSLGPSPAPSRSLTPAKAPTPTAGRPSAPGPSTGTTPVVGGPGSTPAAPGSSSSPAQQVLKVSVISWSLLVGVAFVFTQIRF